MARETILFLFLSFSRVCAAHLLSRCVTLTLTYAAQRERASEREREINGRARVSPRVALNFICIAKKPHSSEENKQKFFSTKKRRRRRRTVARLSKESLSHVSFAKKNTSSDTKEKQKKTKKTKRDHVDSRREREREKEERERERERGERERERERCFDEAL